MLYSIYVAEVTTPESDTGITQVFWKTLRNTKIRQGTVRLLALSVISLCLLTTAQADKVPQTTSVIGAALGDSILGKNKVIYVDFWASWCVPCRKSFPWMKELMDKYGSQGLQVITVNLDKDHAAAKQFLAEVNSSLKVIYDSTGTLAKQYDLQAMPSTYIYGRDGKLRTKHLGFLPKETAELDSLVRTYLAENQQK